MRSSAERARTLAAKAEDDLATASGCLKYGLPLDPACFHLQQATEKLLKALLASRGQDFPLTHDLRRLLDRLVVEFPQLEEFREDFLVFESFAVEIRYEDEMGVSREEALVALEVVTRLRDLIRTLLPPETCP